MVAIRNATFSALRRLCQVCAWSIAGCTAWFATGAQAAEPPGWQFHAGEPGKPAVLLIHGLAASRQHWTHPGATWSIKHAHFDHRKKVADRSGDKTRVGMAYPPLVGLESVRLSPVDGDADRDGSFWAYLVKQGYTVATWNQLPCMDTGDLPDTACKNSDTFKAAYASAPVALAELARLSGNAPLALVGHSRGGLIARQLLKDPAVAERSRVRWLVTLHSPHQGSSMATLGVALQKSLDKLDDLLDLDFLPKELRKPARGLLGGVGQGLNKVVDGLVAVTGLGGARELAANGATLKQLEAGETKPAGVQVVTFGGTSPRVVEVNAFVYDGASADPANGRWTAEPRKLMNFPEALGLAFDELKPGGDLLVTDKASRLPWEDRHVSRALNHAEVLWSREVQEDVHRVLTPVAVPLIKPSGPVPVGNTGVAGEPRR